MYKVYILKSLVAEKFYTGKTDNLERRLKEHNDGYTYYSKRYKPWKIVYEEQYVTEQGAVSREKYLKSAAGRRWIKKRIT
jgi:putative endonuclease